MADPRSATHSGYPLDALPVAAAWVEQGGHVAECNAAWRARLGGAGRALAELIHPEEREAVGAVLGVATEEGERPAVTCRVATPEGWRGYRLQVRADGGIGGLGLGAGWLVCLQEEAVEDDAPLRFAQRVVEELSRELDASRLLERAAEQLVEGLAVTTAFIPILDRDGHGAVVAAAAGEGAERLTSRRVESDAGLCGRIARGGDAGLFPADGVGADPLFPEGVPATIAFAPITYRQRVLGGVCAIPATEATPALLESLRLLARFLSGGLQGARHFDRLRLARDHHQRLLAVLPDPLWLIGPEGTVEEQNAPARDLLESDGIGRPVTTLFGWEAGEQVAAAVAATRDGKRLDLRLNLGEKAVPCLVSVLPFAGGTATDKGALVVARDIREWIASEREREQMRAATEESARLASVGELATGMAHEINNPLMGIINYADLAREELPKDSPVSAWMEVIIEEGERIATLLRHLRSLGRRDPQPPAATHLPEVVEAACALVRHSLGREQIDLVVDIPESLGPVCAVAHQLQQVLVSLFSNARWAVAEARRLGGGGRGWIRLSAREVTSKGGKEVRVVVEDSGVGIAEEDLARVFDPFFTRRSGRSGLGLGLTQARRDVGEWGGRIYAEQGEEGGGRICLLIPKWEERR